MFRFWYRFVLPNLSRISAGLGALVCDEVCGERLNTYTGHAFETCAKQYMWRRLAAGSLPVSFQKIGRWWGTDQSRRAVEIDFIACAGVRAIFGECKWRGEPLGVDALEHLRAKAALLPQFAEKHYMLFSKSGFTKALTTLANTHQDIALVSLPDMLAPI
jgi:hypothetical protein